MRVAPILFLATAGLATAGRALANVNEAPEWLNAAAHLPTPDNAAKAPALILHDEVVLEIDAHGGFTETRRFAIRILRLNGRDHATGSAFYNGSSDKVLQAEAWLLRNGKINKPIPKTDWLDIADNSPGAVIDELRIRTIDLKDVALDDDVFGIETQVRGPLVVAQLGPFHFGEELPFLTEQVIVSVPSGFALDPHLFGPVPPRAETPDSHTWTWTASDGPYRPDEPLAAPGARLDAELIVGLTVPAGAGGFAPRSFSSWSDVAGMYEQINSGQCDSSPEISAKVKELTANCPDPLAKIKALGGFVQKVRYIEINQGLRHGFGWRARKASTVFATGFGDCKDKANLLMAMLRESGITSYRVIALADPDNGRRVHPEFPSPVQFNHAILAIGVDNQVRLPAVLDTTKWGRLLFFDPTDPYTVVGDLPFLLQGTKVHVATPGNNELTDLPDFAPKDDYRVDRHASLALSGGSNVTITAKVSTSGQYAAKFRRMFEQADGSEKVEHLVSTELSDAFRGATIQQKSTDDDRANDTSALSFICFHPRFAQQIPGGGTVVKLDVLSRHYLPNFSETTRELPVELHPVMIRDEVRLDLTGGYTVDEVPAKTSFNSPYGTYEISFAISEGALVMSRQVSLNRMRVSAADYPKLRRFFSDMARADRTSVLLKHGA